MTPHDVAAIDALLDEAHAAGWTATWVRHVDPERVGWRVTMFRPGLPTLFAFGVTLGEAAERMVRSLHVPAA